jgi:hypothetical protein
VGAVDDLRGSQVGEMMRTLTACVLYYALLLLVWLSPLVALIWLSSAQLYRGLAVFAVAYLLCAGFAVWKLRIPGAGIYGALWIRLQEALGKTEQPDPNAPTIIFRMATTIERIQPLYCHLNFTLEEDSKVTLVFRDKLTGEERKVLDEYALPAGDRSLLYRSAEIAVSNYEYETTIAGSKTTTLKGNAVSAVDVCDVSGPGHMIWTSLRSLDGQNLLSWDLVDFGEEETRETLMLYYCSGNAIVRSSVGEGFSLSDQSHLEFPDRNTVVLVSSTNRIYFTTEDGWTFTTQKGYRSNLIRDEATATISFVARDGHLFRYGFRHEDRHYLDEVSQGARVLRRYNYTTSDARCRLESIECDKGKLLRFEYDEDNRNLTRIFKEEELCVALNYDDKRRLTSCDITGGDTFKFDYQTLPIPGSFLSRVTNAKGIVTYFCRYRKGQYLLHTDNGPVTLDYGQAMVVKERGESAVRAHFQNPLDLSRRIKSRIHTTRIIHLPGCGFVTEYRTRGQRTELQEWDLDIHQVVRRAGNDRKVVEIAYDEFAEEIWRNDNGKVTRTWYHHPELFTPPCLTSRISAQLDPKGNLSRHVYNKYGEYLYEVPLVKNKKWYKF